MSEIAATDKVQLPQHFLRSARIAAKAVDHASTEVGRGVDMFHLDARAFNTSFRNGMADLNMSIREFNTFVRNAMGDFNNSFRDFNTSFRYGMADFNRSIRDFNTFVRNGMGDFNTSFRNGMDNFNTSFRCGVDAFCNGMEAFTMLCYVVSVFVLILNLQAIIQFVILLMNTVGCEMAASGYVLLLGIMIGYLIRCVMSCQFCIE
jgi:hypothetical protein